MSEVDEITGGTGQFAAMLLQILQQRMAAARHGMPTLSRGEQRQILREFREWRRATELRQQVMKDELRSAAEVYQKQRLAVGDCKTDVERDRALERLAGRREAFEETVVRSGLPLEARGWALMTLDQVDKAPQNAHVAMMWKRPMGTKDKLRARVRATELDLAMSEATSRQATFDPNQATNVKQLRKASGTAVTDAPATPAQGALGSGDAGGRRLRAVGDTATNTTGHGGGGSRRRPSFGDAVKVAAAELQSQPRGADLSGSGSGPGADKASKNALLAQVVPMGKPAPAAVPVEQQQVTALSAQVAELDAENAKYAALVRQLRAQLTASQEREASLTARLSEQSTAADMSRWSEDEQRWEREAGMATDLVAAQSKTSSEQQAARPVAQLER